MSPMTRKISWKEKTTPRKSAHATAWIAVSTVVTSQSKLEWHIPCNTALANMEHPRYVEIFLCFRL
jgi:hypothetical protein